MGIPNIKFIVNSDGLSQLAEDIEKIPALVVTGQTVADNVTIGKSYQVFSLNDVKNLGIEKEGVNAFPYKHLEAFYNEAGEGAPLWIMLVSSATTYETMVDVNEDIARKLVEDAKGDVRVLGIVKESTGGENIVNGIDEDVVNAIPKLHALSEYFSKNDMPIRSVISGNNFNGIPADLQDYTESNYNRALMLLANNDGAGDAGIGQLLGRLSKIPSQRSIARVKDGAIEPLQAYFTGGQTIESLTNAWDAIHDKGYVFMRTFPSKSGYYYTDDKMLTANTDDFNALARGLVMDEAIIIAQSTLTDELSDEIPVQEDGTIHPAIIKSWQQSIESQIEGLMVNIGKLSGVSVVIDANQNVLQTSEIEVQIELLPIGYAKKIQIKIKYTTQIEG